MALLLWSSACTVHLRGAVHGVEGVAWLQEPEGRERRLRLGADSMPLLALDGEGVEIDGRLGPGGLRVTDWNVTDGVHGLQPFVGVLVERQGRLGLEDRNSQAFYLFDDRRMDDMIPLLGQVVLVEGWVEGAQRVRVAYVRGLTGSEPSR